MHLDAMIRNLGKIQKIHHKLGKRSDNKELENNKIINKKLVKYFIIYVLKKNGELTITNDSKKYNH